LQTLSEAPITSPELLEKTQLLRQRIASVVALPERTLDHVLVGLLARGHVLIDGVPGVGKTLLAQTVARAIQCDFKRIQFTNDLLPSDIVGTTLLKPDRAGFVFRKGPIFANVVLADEINRTSTRTLSCLLEAMESGRVSVEGRQVPLPSPFFVLATRNPIEFHGTFPIPEAALDRFLIQVSLSYPTDEEELALYLGDDPAAASAALEPVLTAEEVAEIADVCSGITISEPVAAYCQRLVKATRESPAVRLGASPRAALFLLRAARARAFLLEGRTYVLPDDLKDLAVPVLAHRLVMDGGGGATEFLEDLLQRTPIDL
jgi:MoxR-like ATPase